MIGTFGDGTFCMGTLKMAIKLIVGPHGLFRIRIPVHFNTDPDLSGLNIFPLNFSLILQANLDK